MAAIAYLHGGERPTADLMNQIFAAFDAKMATMLTNKSFFLSQNAAMTQKFCGRAFFFTIGKGVYATRVPGWVDSGGSVTRPYNHADFTSAVAGINPALVTWDETNKIATVPAFLTSQYNGLTTYMNTTSHVPVGNGLLDWSLQAHYLLHQGVSDSVPVPYYILETSTGTGAALATLAPEKRYDFGLAELILEGQTNVTLPASYDKYNCFRIHNLNYTNATVVFTDAGGAAVFRVDLGPLECQTVRRDDPTTNYRLGGRYFFNFEPGDPRFYWFFPKGFTVNAGTTGPVPSPSDTGVCVTNSEQANNLTNPAILLDWQAFYTRDLGVGALFSGANFARSALDIASQYCGWHIDPSVQYDMYQHWYAGKYGDPANPNTLIGDLIHHQGEFLIVRASKTLTDPATGSPVLTFQVGRFNGYASIVADFAAYNLAVTTNGSGNLVIKNSDAANNVFIVPYATNMWKTGNTHPTAVSLVPAAGFTVENAILENTTPTTLSTTAPQLIFQPSASTSTNSFSYYLYDAGTGTYSDVHTVTGNPVTTLDWTHTRSSAKVLNGIQTLKVSDLLTLDYWGEPTLSGQNGTYVTITNRSMTLTPEGLVILYTEQDSPARSTSDSDWFGGNHGQPIVKQIQLRGHGFGYVGTNGSRDSGWVSCRDGRYTYTDAYTAEIQGLSGTDFSVGGTATQTGITVQTRHTAGSVASNGRFWSTTPGDFLAQLMQNYASMTPSVFGAAWAVSTPGNGVTGINNGSAAVTTVSPTLRHTMTLLPEMYNELARATNAIDRCAPLNWKCLRWNVFGKVIGLDSCTAQFGGTFGTLVSNVEGIEDGTWDAAANTPALQSGVGIPGHFYQISNAGSTNLDGISSWALGNFAYFDKTGVWMKKTSLPAGGPEWGGYKGFVPLEMFAKFDAGSQYDALCAALGITVRTYADFPGGVSNDPSAPGAQPFSHFLNHDVGNAIFLNEIIVAGSGLSVSGSGPTYDVTLSLTGTTFCDLLSTGHLLRGQATGTNCAGVWNNALHPVTPSNANIGQFYVVGADDPTSPAGNLKKGDLILIKKSGEFHQDMTALLNRQTGLTVNPIPFGTGNYGLQAFQTSDIKWIKISDVQAVVEALGFKFAHFESFIPAMLMYFENSACTKTNAFTQNRGTLTATSHGTTHNPSSFGLNDAAFQITSSGVTIGAQIGFYISTSTSDCQWKNFFMLTKGYGYAIGNILPIGTTTNLFSAVRYAMSASISGSSVGVTGSLNGLSGGFQKMGTTNDTVSSTDISFDTGYDVNYWVPTTNFRQATQIGVSGPGAMNGYQTLALFNQVIALGIQCVLSAGYTGFVSTITLLGNELFMVQPDIWTSSLTYANAAFDFSSFTTGFRDPFPINYVPAPAATTSAVGAGYTIISAPVDNQLYSALLSLSVPLVTLN
jgi:hypothetical protein